MGAAIVKASWRGMAFAVDSAKREGRTVLRVRRPIKNLGDSDGANSMNTTMRNVGFAESRTRESAETVMREYIAKRIELESKTRTKIERAAKRPAPEWTSTVIEDASRAVAKIKDGREKLSPKPKTPEEILAEYGDAVTFEIVEESPAPVVEEAAPGHETTVTEVDGFFIPSCSCGWVQDNGAFQREDFALMRGAHHRRQPEFDVDRGDVVQAAPKQQEEETAEMGRGSKAPKKTVPKARVGDIVFSDKSRFPSVATVLGHRFVVRKLAGLFEAQHEHSDGARLIFTGEDPKNICRTGGDMFPNLPALKRAILADAVARGEAEHQEQPEPVAEEQKPTAEDKQTRRERPWEFPIDAKGRELKVGDLVLQAYDEIVTPYRIERLVKNGAVSVDAVAVGEDGGKARLLEHCASVVRVTEEQIAALPAQYKVEANGHRGWIRPSNPVLKPGKIRATCVCMSHMEISQEGHSRKVAWFSTTEEAEAAWHRHAAAEPFVEDDQDDEEAWNAEETPEVSPGYAAQQVNSQGEKTDGTEGMWWATCNGGREGCYEFGHIITPDSDTSFRETEEAARALGEWHLGGGQGPAPTDRFPGQAEASRVVWASFSYEFVYRAECTVSGCDAEHVFKGGKGTAKTAADKRRAVRDAAVAWTVEHAGQHQVEAAADPVAVFIVSARSNPTRRRVLWGMTRTDAMKLCSDDRTSSDRYMLCWTAPEHLGVLGDDWEWTKDRGTTDAVIAELGVTILDRAVLEQAAADTEEIPVEDTPAGDVHDPAVADTEEIHEHLGTLARWESFPGKKHAVESRLTVECDCGHVVWKRACNGVYDRQFVGMYLEAEGYGAGPWTQYEGADLGKFGMAEDATAPLVRVEVVKGDLLRRMRKVKPLPGLLGKAPDHAPCAECGSTITMSRYWIGQDWKMGAWCGWCARFPLEADFENLRDTAAVVDAKRGFCLVRPEQPADTQEKTSVMGGLLEKHYGPDWRGGCTFEDVDRFMHGDYDWGDEEPQAPVQGPLTREQRRAAWRLHAGEPAPKVTVTPLDACGVAVSINDGSSYVSLVDPVAVWEGEGGAVPGVETPQPVAVEEKPKAVLPSTGRGVWEVGSRVLCEGRPGRVVGAGVGITRVLLDGAEPGRLEHVEPRSLVAENYIVCGGVMVPTMPEKPKPVAVDPRIAWMQYERVAVEEQHQEQPVDPRIAWMDYERPEPEPVDVLAELRAELEAIRADVDSWGAEVAALAVAEAERVVREVAADLRAAEVLALREEARELREGLGWGPVRWEPVPQQRRSGWGLAASVAGALAWVGAALGQVVPPRG
ncbi:hypothetical protein ABT213_06110 [Streptomyces sp. NPDC001674]|uniref:hypothetical protein n=1 Tax=Streptomyces sp. NPDC001674 TaxID=3154394 RepID=UPI00332D2E20